MFHEICYFETSKLLWPADIITKIFKTLLILTIEFTSTFYGYNIFNYQIYQQLSWFKFFPKLFFIVELMVRKKDNISNHEQYQ